MHELAIAESVVAIAGRHASGHRVVRVELKVGMLRQVVPSALEFAFELVAQGTAVEGAELVQDQVPARVACRACESETEVKRLPLACGRCEGFDVRVVAGEELLVDALELEDEEQPVATTGGNR